jgi:hypothetical protein
MNNAASNDVTPKPVQHYAHYLWAPRLGEYSELNLLTLHHIPDFNDEIGWGARRRAFNAHSKRNRVQDKMRRDALSDALNEDMDF